MIEEIMMGIEGAIHMISSLIGYRVYYGLQVLSIA